MKKIIKFSLLSIAFFAVISFFNIKDTEAQSVMCPAGYTCTPAQSLPNCPAGYVCTKTTSGSNNGNATSTSVIPGSSFAVKSSTLSLSYDSQKNEADLTSRISITINGGKNGLYLYQNNGGAVFSNQTTGEVYNLHNQTHSILPVLKSNTRLDNQGQNMYFIEPNTSSDFVVITKVPANNLFAGTYKASLGALIVNSSLLQDNDRRQLLSSNTSNSVVVVGEKGPYIKSVTNPVKAGDKITINGERLNGKSKSEVVTIFLEGVSSGLGFTASADGKEIQLTLPKTIAKGGHILEVNNSVTGRSNRVDFTIDSENTSNGSVSIPSLSAYLLDAKSNKAGIWDNFGPGAGNGNKTEKDWHWVVSLNKFSNEPNKIKSITVTHAGNEAWSTASENVFGRKPYPLVVVGNQNNPVSVSRITKYLDDNSGLTSSSKSASISLDLYGQIESSSWNGGMVTIKYTDGKMESAYIPASNIKAVDINLVDCPVGVTCTSIPAIGTTGSGTAITAPSLVVTSPNGGSFPINSQQNIAWKSTVTDFAYYSINLKNKYSGNVGIQIADRVPKDNNTFKFNLSKGIVDGVVANSGGMKAEQISNQYYIEILAMKPVYLNSTGAFAGYSFDVMGKSNYFSITTTVSATIPTPYINSVYPSSAKAGETFTIYGTNLDKTQVVNVSNGKGGEFTLTPKTKTAGSMTFTVPNYTAMTYLITLLGTNGSDSNNIEFAISPTTVTSTNTTVAPASTAISTTQEIQIPSIISFYPTITRVGDDVKLTGKGFDKVNTYDIYLENDKGVSATPMVKSKTSESMVFTVPQMSAGIYRLYIVGRDGNSNTVNLTIASLNGASVSSAWEWISSLFK